jgi:hypothetical protein
MLRGATPRAPEMVGTAVLRIVVSSDSMKKATATSHGKSPLDTVTIRNSGALTGAEVVQLYLEMPRSTEEPVRQHEGFQRVRLDPGEQRQIRFAFAVEELSRVHTQEFFELLDLAPVKSQRLRRFHEDRCLNDRVGGILYVESSAESEIGPP